MKKIILCVSAFLCTMLWAPFDPKFFPKPVRGPVASSIGNDLRQAVADRDAQDIRKNLSNMRATLGWDWQLLLQRFADGYFTPGILFDTKDETLSELFKTATGVYPYEIDGTKAKSVWLEKIERELQVARDTIRRLIAFFEEKKGVAFSASEKDPFKQLGEFLDRLEANDGSLFADTRSELEDLKKRLAEQNEKYFQRESGTKKATFDTKRKLEEENKQLDAQLQQQKVALDAEKAKVRKITAEKKQLLMDLETAKKNGAALAAPPTASSELQKQLEAVQKSEQAKQVLISEKEAEIQRVITEKDLVVKKIAAEKDALQKQIAQMQNTQNKLLETVTEKTRLLEAANTESSALRAQLATGLKTIAEKEQEVLQLQAEQQRLLAEQTSAKNELAETKNRLNAGASFSDERDKLQTKVRQLEEKLKLQESAVTTLAEVQKQLTGMQEIHNQQVQRLAEKEAEVKRISVEKEVAVKKIEAEREALLLQIAQVQEKQKNLSDTLVEKTLGLEAADKEVAALRAQVAAGRKTISDREQELLKLQAEQQTFVAKQGALTNELAAVQKQLSLSMAPDENKKLQTKIAQLEEKLQLSESAVKVLAAVQKQLTSLQEEQKQQAQHLAAKEALVAQLRNEKEHLTNKVAEAQWSLDELQKVSAEENKKLLDQKNQELLQQNERLLSVESEASQLRGLQEKKEQSITDLHGRAQRLEKTVNQQKAQSLQQQEKIAALERENLEKEQKIIALEGAAANLASLAQDKKKLTEQVVQLEEVQKKFQNLAAGLTKPTRLTANLPGVGVVPDGISHDATQSLGEAPSGANAFLKHYGGDIAKFVGGFVLPSLVKNLISSKQNSAPSVGQMNSQLSGADSSSEKLVHQLSSISVDSEDVPIYPYEQRAFGSSVNVYHPNNINIASGAGGWFNGLNPGPLAVAFKKGLGV